MILLQTPSLWSVQGSITVVGLLLVIVFAFYSGLIVTGRDMKEIKARLEDREEENVTLHNERVKDIEEKAELRGEIGALRAEVAGLRNEINSLRQEAERLRKTQEG